MCNLKQKAFAQLWHDSLHNLLFFGDISSNFYKVLSEGFSSSHLVPTMEP